MQLLRESDTAPDIIMQKVRYGSVKAIAYFGGKFDFRSDDGQNTTKLPWSCIYAALYSKQKGKDREQDADGGKIFEEFYQSVSAEKRSVNKIKDINDFKDAPKDKGHLGVLNVSQFTSGDFSTICQDMNKAFAANHIFFISGVFDDMSNPFLTSRLKTFVEGITKLQTINLIIFDAESFSEREIFEYDGYKYNIEDYLKEVENDGEKTISLTLIDSSVEEYLKPEFSESGESVDEILEYEAPSKNDLIFYVDNQRKRISAQTHSNDNSCIKLLNCREIEDIPSLINKQNKRTYFYRFLRSSANEPQWFAYAARFYVQRDIDEKLVRLTKSALKKHSENKPICLYGGSGCGKSVTAEYVAYTIFTENQHPVLYIDANEFFREDNSDSSYETNKDELLTLLGELEEDNNQSVLIVLDNIGFKFSRAMNLFDFLKIKAKRFALLFTSYAEYDEKKCNNVKADEKDSSDAFYASLRTILKKAAGVQSEDLDYYIDCARKYNDFLSIMYVLFNDSLLRASLGKNIKKEGIQTVEYLKEVMDEDSQQTNPFMRVIMSQYKNKNLQEMTIKFLNMCAVCKKFGKAIPQDFALRATGCVIDTSRVPFFNATEENGEIYFSLRSEIEAELWLDMNGVSCEKEVEIICEYIEDASLFDGGKDVSFIIGLLQALSINSADSQDEKQRNTLKKYVDHYDKIITALHKRNPDPERVPDNELSLALQEIIYAREHYYNRLSNKHLKEIHPKSQDELMEFYLSGEFTPYGKEETSDEFKGALAQAVAVLGNNIKTAKIIMEKNDSLPISTRLSLINEICIAYRRIAELQKSGYLPMKAGVATLKNVAYPDEKTYAYKDFTKNCEEMLRESTKAIALDSANSYANFSYLYALGYAYRSAERNKDEEKMLDISCKIIQRVEQNMTDKESDVLENTYVAPLTEKVLDVISRDDLWQEMFDKLIAKKSPTGIVIAIYKELHKNEIKLTDTEWSEEKLAVIEALNRDYIAKYETITSRHKSTLYYAIYFKWILYNQKTIFHPYDMRNDISRGWNCMLTAMDQAQWEEIRNLCTEYLDLKHEESDIISRDEKFFSLKRLCDWELSLVYRQKPQNYHTEYEKERGGKSSFIREKGDNISHHIICDKYGNPFPFRGKISDNIDYSEKSHNSSSRSGGIEIEGVSEKSYKSIYYHRSNIDGLEDSEKKSELKRGRRYDNFNLGVGKLGLSIYRRVNR